MRLLVSFFLSLIIYSAIIYFFLFFVIPKNKKQEEVLIHTAIIPQKIEKNINNNKTKKTIKNTTPVKKTQPKKVKKIGSKTNIKKGGSVDFNDIFKNVKENIETTPVKLKKSDEMSRFKGIKRVEKLLKKVKNLNVNVEFENKSSTKITNEKINEIINKIGEIWYEISVIPGEYAKINVINQNGNVYVTILDSNLDLNKQEELVNRIKSLHFNENFDINILFQTKVNK
jgi:hypothetical protein